MNIEIRHESRLIQGHVLDCARAPLVAALKRYDPQLYLKWKPSKRDEPGLWELRRKPELKTVRQGRCVDTPTKGRVYIPGDILEMPDGSTWVYPKYHETSHDVVKKFQYADYRILDWVAKHDLWQYGYKGSNFANEADYHAAKYEEKIDEESYAEKMYGLKQMRTQINDFKNYVNSGGDPYRLLDFWK